MCASFAARFRAAALITVTSFPVGCREEHGANSAAETIRPSAGAALDVSALERSKEVLERQLQFKRCLKDLHSSFQSEVSRRIDGTVSPMSDEHKLERATLIDKARGLVADASEEERRDLVSNLLDSIKNLTSLHRQVRKFELGNTRPELVSGLIHPLQDYLGFLTSLDELLGALNRNQLKVLGRQIIVLGESVNGKDPEMP